MPSDPNAADELARITGTAPGVPLSTREREAILDRTFAAVGIDSPAVMAAPVAIYSIDLAGNVASWNTAAEQLYGWTAAEIIGDVAPFLPPDEFDTTFERLARLFRGEDIGPSEFSPRHKDGRRLHVVSSATLLRGADDEPTAILVFATDMTAQKEASLALEAAHHKWRHLLMNISDTVTILDRDCHVRETTGQYTDVLGYAPSQWVGATGFELLHPDDLGRAAELWEQIVAHPGAEARAVFRTQHADGHFELVEFNGVSLLEDPIVDGVVMTTRNVTAQKSAEALLADEAQVLELIARDAPLDATLPAIARLVEYHSSGSSSILLLSQGGRTLEIGAPGSVPPDLLEIVRRASLGPNPYTDSFDLRRPIVISDLSSGGVTRHFAERAAELGYQAAWIVPIIENRTEELLGIIATYFHTSREPDAHEGDVAEVASHLASIAIERDRWQQALYHQARHHQLTGLPNRSLILENLDAAILRAQRDQSTVAVMFIDLDRFKVVNDSLGHAAGDKLLVRFSGRLANLVRPGDFVGHFGADEFIVILENIGGEDDIRFVANRLDLALAEPFALDEGEIFLSTSIGVATSREGVENSEALLQHADAAMFRAKDLGRDRMEIFDLEMRTRAVEQLRIDRGLRLAVERAELEVYYQPKIDVSRGTICGAEALLRWNHPERGLVFPDEFIGVAEETGIIVRIGRWVLEEAILQARDWVEQQPDLGAFIISVNMSARQIGSPGLVDQVERVLKRCGWPADQLVLELTESILIDDREATLDVLEDLKALGVKLAIDDFGTGFSSLNYLHRFPVDIVKIDRSFVSNLQANGDGSPVATAVMHMAHALGLLAAAEGVEEAQQLAGLRQLGCDIAQGFLFEKGVPARKFAELLRSYTPW